MMNHKTQKYEEAKELYAQHNCSYYYMQHADVLEKYLSFNVPKEMEKQWHNDIEVDTLNSIKHEKNLSKLQMFCSNFISITDINGLIFLKNFLLSRTESFDTFTNIRLVESLFCRIRVFAETNKLQGLEVMEETLHFLLKLAEKPIMISIDYYNKDGTKPDYLCDDVLIKRMNHRIKEYSDLYEKIKNENEVLLLK